MNLVTTSMMFVAAAAAIPSYLIITSLGIDNTYLVYIIPGLANTTCLFLMKQFLDTVPNDIFEAGKIDGASEWQLYTKIADSASKECTGYRYYPYIRRNLGRCGYIDDIYL